MYKNMYVWYQRITIGSIIPSSMVPPLAIILNPEPRTPNPEPRTPNPEPRTPNPEPRTPNPEPRTPNPEPRTPNPEPRTPNPEPRTPNPEPRTPNPEPRTPNPEPRTPNPEPRAVILCPKGRHAEALMPSFRTPHLVILSATPRHSELDSESIYHRNNSHPPKQSSLQVRHKGFVAIACSPGLCDIQSG